VVTLHAPVVLQACPCGLLFGQFGILEYTLFVTVTGQAKSLTSLPLYCHVPDTATGGAVHIRVYVVVDPGETERVPEIDTAPMLSFNEQVLAFVEPQVSVDGEPAVIDDGFAERVAVGVGVFGLILAVQVALADPPVLLVTVARPVFSPVVVYALETVCVVPERLSVPVHAYEYEAVSGPVAR